MIHCIVFHVTHRFFDWVQLATQAFILTLLLLLPFPVLGVGVVSEHFLAQAP